MEVRVLRYFIAVANHKNISAAAAELYVSQPTLSRQLKDLEIKLDTTLFIRGNRHITLTDEGQFLLKKAREIVDLIDKTKDSFKESNEIIGGDIFIGCGETKAMQLIAGSIKTLIEEHPNIHFHLHSGNADEITAKLDSGLMDFGVVIEPVDKQKYEFMRIPATDTWGVLMRRDSSLATKPYIEPNDIMMLPLLVSRQTAVSNELTGWFGKRINHLKIVGTYNLIYNAALMVEENIGYAIGLDRLINTTGNSKLCFKPLRPNMASSLYLIWKKNQVFSNAAEMFLEIFRKSIILGQ